MSRRNLALVLLVVPVLIAAGCGGSSGGGSSSSTTSTQSAAKTSSASKAGGATVAVRKTDLGTILVNSSGRTLYLFEKDKGTKSTCSGACAAAWPPLTTTSTPKPATGVTAGKLGTSMRSDGTKEVTYNGHPLYTYAGDSSPGQTSGQALDQFGAEWYVLSPKGSKVEKGGS
jgi:predicted lipoprotein with Yx(FWY)xxD motif